MKKLFFLFITCFLGLTVSAQTYSPSAVTSFTGANTYCVGAAITTPLVVNYNTCAGGAGAPTGVTCTVNWYYNTTNSTAIPGATLVSGPNIVTCAAAATGSISYTPSTASLPVGGDYYFFCVISWTGGVGACPATGSITTSTTQLIRVQPAPITPTAPVLNVCVGSTLPLSNPMGGGNWSSFNPAVVSVNASGVATGVSAGGSFITYTIGSCYVTAYVYANDTPSTITTSSNFTPCEATTLTLNSTPASGTWTSNNTSVANINISSGVVNTGSAGTARITYTNSATGCFVTRVLTVIANPPAITGTTGVCITNNTTLSNLSPGAWSSSNPTVASITSGTGVVTGNNQGTAIITFTASSNNCRVYTTVTVGLPPNPITGPNTVCAGSNITLANTISGGAWSSQSAAVATVNVSTGVVTGVTNATVNISYTTPGCTAVFKNITVNPLPGTILGVLTTCYGQSTSLTSTVSGGTWYSDIPTIASVDSVSGVVSGHSMGSTIITYKVGSGCMTMANVTVNPLAPIVGPDSVCVGSKILLTDIVGGGTWISSNPAIASIDPASGVVTGLINGITFIGYTLPTGCASTFFLNVIPPLPPIAGPMEVCSGSTAVLSNGVGGGRWGTSNMYVAEIDSVTGGIIGRFPDTATITYTRFGCITKTHVTVNPLPVVTLTYDWLIAKLSTLPVYASYQWYDSTVGAIPGATTNTLILPNVKESYYLRATDFKGCANNSEWFRFPLGMRETDMAAQCKIFPNPATAIVHIDAPIRVKAVISTIEGKAVSVTPDAREVNVSNLPPGFYLIGLYDDSGQLIVMQRLTKE
ncbi:hypothetical protein GCM10023093_01290 [Nemorincola caseinilytica]|uniref:BIG2 domain-containing protein n=1 Tax=Nemorincola caseinilytica TaxID=2054315 RepID=A0ABP8N1M0_9BACT